MPHKVEMPAAGSWKQTYEALSTADREGTLEPADLERLAIAAYLTGRDAEIPEILTRAHNGFLARCDVPRAARAAFWLVFVLMNGGERARAAGWLARTQRLLDEGAHDCVERGYVLVPVAIEHVARGEIAAAAGIFEDAARIGERFGDADLVCLARQGRGRALIAQGEVARGVALLDEVMVAVTSGEVSPPLSGTIYCSVISACFDMLDMRRAQEWTDVLNDWCRTQSDAVPYRGECLVHRAAIMLLHGGWQDAIEEAQRACEWLSQRPGRSPIGAAFYQLAELHRHRGEFAKAEDAYRMASQAGRTPHPGLALLRLAQGRTEDARAAISRVLDESRDRRTRPRVLAAAIEIMLADGDVAAARTAADELGALAAGMGTPFARALSAHATGAVVLAEGDARRALGFLRDACRTWQEIEAPYEAARATVLIALACRVLGDADGARFELDSAAGTFRTLGAAPDLARVERLATGQPAPPAGPLTAREIQVLKLVANGSTNRAIAEALDISEKTVARHVSNIFTKLDLSSRAAATAYAFKHRII